jgi:hypothetical protein
VGTYNRVNDGDLLVPLRYVARMSGHSLVMMCPVVADAGQ